MADDAEDGEAEEVTAGTGSRGEVAQGVHGVQLRLVSVSGQEEVAGEGR